MRVDKKDSKAFTLIELLVVIAIIALLLSVLLPSLKKAKEATRKVVCKSNQRQLFVAATMFHDDHEGFSLRLLITAVTPPAWDHSCKQR